MKVFDTSKKMDFSAFINQRSISDLDIQFNPDGWGPINGEKKSIFEGVPYAHFDKKDRCGRAADFAQLAMQNSYQKERYQKYHNKRDEYLVGTDFSFKHDTAEDNTFQLVDSSKTQTKNKYGKLKHQNFS